LDALQHGLADAGAWAGTTAQLGRSTDYCGLEWQADMATGARRGGSRSAAGDRAARGSVPAGASCFPPPPSLSLSSPPPLPFFLPACLHRPSPPPLRVELAEVIPVEEGARGWQQ